MDNDWFLPTLLACALFLLPLVQHWQERWFILKHHLPKVVLKGITLLLFAQFHLPISRLFIQCPEYTVLAGNMMPSMLAKPHCSLLLLCLDGRGFPATTTELTHSDGFSAFSVWCNYAIHWRAFSTLGFIVNGNCLSAHATGIAFVDSLI